MSKRRRSGDEIDVIIPNKQICLHNESSEKSEPEKYASNGDNKSIPMETSESEQQGIHQGKASTKKETSAGEVKKGRRRTSGRWDFHGGSLRDPLNLKNVRPEEPSDEIYGEKVVEEPKKENKSKRAKKDDSFDNQLQNNAKKTIYHSQADKGAKDEDEKQQSKLEDISASKPAIKRTTDQQRANHRKKMGERFRYGNFNNYHSKKDFHHHFFHRPPPIHHFHPPPPHQFQSNCPFDGHDDPRLDIFCPDWFVDKSILDVGCNAGYFAISLARRFQPKRVIGIDLDQHLVGAARKNIRLFAEQNSNYHSILPLLGPSSAAAMSGPLPTISYATPRYFPDNIWFFCENYVLKTDKELEKVKEEFDIIFALAITKWVHLNWGDVGIRRFFQRIFRQLCTGGRFVLETAPFRVYKKHCNKKGGDRPPEGVLNNFEGIRFYPEEFTDFLLNEVGFSHHEELSTPQAKQLGISGRLQVFYKGKFMLTADEKTPKYGEEEEQQQITQSLMTSSMESPHYQE